MNASERIEFTGSQGEQLAARLDRPSAMPRAFAIFAHCFTCSKDIAAAARIARALAARGLAVLRFDFTGLGHSGGEFENTNFSSNVADLLRAADWLREHHRAPSLLVGHSLGGAAVIAAANDVPEVRAVATLGAPSDTAHLEHIFSPSVPEIEASGSAEVSIAGRPFRVQKQFLEDIREQNQRERIGALRSALLVMHSVTDNVVGIDHAAKIFMAAKHPKSFISLDQADHLLGRREDAEYAALVLSAWADRYLPPAEAGDASGHGEVVVEETRTGKFSQLVRAGRHVIAADEPASFGGDDSGLSPYELLLASLGTCTSMTLRMYAEHKGLALGPVRVRLKHDKIHAEDCEDCETWAGKIDRIEREIELVGELTPAQRERLLEIADRCPVHRTLHSEVSVVTRETPPADGRPEPE